MSETKTYVVPEGNNNLAAMAMMNGGFNNGMWQNPFVYLVWMWMMRWMNNDQGGDPAVQRQIQTLQDQMQDNHNSDLLMSAIRGNNSAIQDLSSRLNCDYNALTAAVQNVKSGIDTVGGQVGYSSERVINAIESGNSSVIQALNNCCCTTQKSILEQSYQNQLSNERQTYQITNSVDTVGKSVERGFCDTAYATQAQTCALQNTIKDTSTINTNSIIAKLDAMQNQALLDKIDTLREKNSQQAVIINNAQQTTAFSQMINQATTPIYTAITSLQNEVGAIKGRLPETVTLPYSCATAIPTQLAYNGYNNTLWG